MIIDIDSKKIDIYVTVYKIKSYTINIIFTLKVIFKLRLLIIHSQLGYFEYAYKTQIGCECRNINNSDAWNALIDIPIIDHDAERSQFSNQCQRY